MDSIQPDGDLEVAAARSKRRFPAQDARDRRRALISGTLFTVMCMLLVNAVVGENGYLATLAVRREEAALLARRARLRMENQELQQAARRLTSDPSALEETARRELGLLRPGETLLVIRDIDRPAPGAASSK
jgi:cell division protein FtsB